MNHIQQPYYNACMQTSCCTFCVPYVVPYVVIGPTAFITDGVSFMIKVFWCLLLLHHHHHHHVSSTHIGYVCHMPICITVPGMSVVAVSYSCVVQFSTECMYTISQCLYDTDSWLSIKTYIACIQFYQLWLLYIGRSTEFFFPLLFPSRLTGRNVKMRAKLYFDMC